MNAFCFDSITDELPAEWRALDRAVYRWTLAHGGTHPLAWLAGWASLADGHGDTAISLHEPPCTADALTPLDAGTIAQLRSSCDLVGDGRGTQPTAFVIDADGQFFLWRNHADETALADAIRARLRSTGSGTNEADDRDVDTLFGGRDDAAVARQRRAVARVPDRRLFVLTGGPGTGKTTTVLRMLVMLQRHADRPLRVRACAPTGKAAQRLLQALRDGRKSLTAGEHALPSEWQPLLDCIPDGEALTLHRLLGLHPATGRYAHHRGNPLPADVVVVDEASMVDLGMMRALFDALAAHTTLILVGDADQLASVAAGTALADIVAALEHRTADELVRLEHSFRAEQPLQALNVAIRHGDRADLHAAIGAAPTWIERCIVDGIAPLHAQLDRWADRIAALPIRPTLSTADTAARRAAVARDALLALASLQLLCALRDGLFGALAANARIEQRLHRTWLTGDEFEWYPGRAVMVTRNDYSARLFNGDVGLCLADDDGTLRVWFETTAPDGTATARAIAPAMLPAHEGAFAITIHKSQGSEYREAAVLLPPDPDHRALSRHLLYTGASRAKQRLELWSSNAALDAAVLRTVSRGGGLRRKLVTSTHG